MTYEEIEKLLQYHERESKVFIPNEILEELKCHIPNSPHIAFAYSYYYLICWLYRYAKYGVINDIDNKKIKEILGYTAITKGLDYLIKKNGVLDDLGYTITTKDFPLSWTYEDDFLEFDLLSDMDEDIQRNVKQQYSRKYTIKFPPKAFHRTKESKEDSYLDGTFYEVDNTHLIPFEVFLFCMSKKELECTGFYLYSYIKRMNDYHSGGWDVSIENMALDTGIAENTLIRYLDQLRKYKMIEGIHNQEYFCLALDPSERKANTYITNDFDLFTYKPQFYEKIKVMSSHDYYKLREEEFENLFGSGIDISVEELPY
ncbi:hypothetical protein [Bacillus sp. JJ1474]|uniref:hypothetical protein n=1 Tax=Bacillus sp. JJ1474 TaxID=3122955 RepID=UPI002FFE5AAB